MEHRIRIMAVLAALLLIPQAVLRGQEVVIDPSQIAASAVNAADQMDYMIDQLGELTELGDKLGGLKTYMDDLFGEDGVGGKAIGLLQDLGTIDRLAECFTSTMEAADRYAAQCRSMDRHSLTDVNVMLSYLNSSKRQAEMILDAVKKILDTVGFTRKDKKDEVERAVSQLEAQLDQMKKVMEIETNAAYVAQGLTEFTGMIAGQTDSRLYAESRQPYGTQQGAARGTLGAVSVLLGLMGVLMSAFCCLSFARGGITGDPTAENVFIRLAVAMTAGMLVLSFISKIIGVTL